MLLRYALVPRLLATHHEDHAAVVAGERQEGQTIGCSADAALLASFETAALVGIVPVGSACAGRHRQREECQQEFYF